VLLCDWLPPDFGAVGQYSLQRAEQLANDGHHVTLVGFASQARAERREQTTAGGSLHVQFLDRSGYDKSKLLKRAWWTLSANLALLRVARAAIKSADEVIFTGSPPYLLHFIAPANFFWRKQLVYRITDFHPECLMAEYDAPPLWLRAIYRITLFWRKRVPMFEAIGDDQRVRLAAIGISAERMRLVRDPAPVAFAPELIAAAKPSQLATQTAILYSGNFGVAHDHATFLDGFALFQKQHPNRAGLWLNAVGKKADLVQAQCQQRQLPVHRSQPVAIEELPALLKAADVHLITLREPFVGFVLPSKVYACIASDRPILYIGPQGSDVHLLCSRAVAAHRYRQVEIGDAAGVALALEALLLG
jgi:hypothetical protein